MALIAPATPVCRPESTPSTNRPCAEGAKKPIKITPEEIQIFSKYIYGISGIHIEASKAYLLETRLGRLLETQDCCSYSEFYHKAKSDVSKKLEKQVIDAITTNETLFFRDANPFDLMKHKIIPEVIDNRSSSAINKPIRIWSAACSTGQEVFSIAIILKELLGQNHQIDIQLLGTDLSDAAIRQASYGAYNKFEIERGLPKDLLKRYFTSSGSTWKVKDGIRSMATFRKFNLTHPFSSVGRFDVVFCRNVAIYFTLEDRKKLFNKIADVLEPNGFLIIGSTESLTGVCPRFVPKRHLKSIFYQLR